MQTTPYTILTTAIALLLVGAPLAAASAAHPHTHMFAGTSAQNAFVNMKTDGIKEKLQVNVDLVGVCADVTPVTEQLFPVEPVRDGDTETGVGGSCFSFHSVYGDDTGTVRSVFVQDFSSQFLPVYVVCVDVNGDGLCSNDLGTDEFNLCASTATGPVSLLDGGACSIYENPAATLNPYVYVLVVGGLTDDHGAIAAYADTGGYIFLS